MFRMLTFPHCLVTRVAIATTLGLASVHIASAQDPSVTAMLSSSETGVGEPVEFQIKVTGVRNTSPPADISIDGLDVRSAGQMQSFEMRNFDITSSVTYNYNITPLRTGRFIIPAVTINAGGKSLRTAELQLNVGGSSKRSSSGGNTASLDPKDLASAELIVPKKTVYVGESVPVELRVSIDTRARCEPVSGPQLESQGFTIQKIQRAGEAKETRNGRLFTVVVFKTAIAAAKGGNLELGPVKLETRMQWPRARSKRFAPRDIFGMDDPFDSLMLNPFADLTPPVPVTITSEPVTIEVKTLPANAPASFGGAIGNFNMMSEVNPKSGQIGDPFTIKTQISGRGNFDRVTAPPFEDEHGWRKYPPASNFKQDDDVGISGTKTFETVLSPNEPKDKVPPQIFSYFDPLQEQYVTLHGAPLPIQVQGGAAPTPGPPTLAASAPTVAGARSLGQKQQDILYQITELPTRPQSFTPLFARASFWLAQLFPLLALLGLVGWNVHRAHRDNREIQRREALQRESAELHRSLRRDDLPPHEYISRASRAVQLKTALAKNVDPNSVDAELAAAAFAADEETRTRLRRLFEKSDEARYSGDGANGIYHAGLETRTEVLDLMEKLNL